MTDAAGCKVDLVSDRYGLDATTSGSSLDERLLARWTGADGRSPEGYRPLTDWFNRRVLKVVYDRHGRDTVAARLDGDFETLTGDDDLRRAELLDDLDADGIDGERLVADMVSWGTMRNHLNDCLGGEKAREPARTEWERESIRIATDRVQTKVNEAVGSLARKGEVNGAASASLSVDVQLTCDRCGARVPLDVALSRGYVCERHHADGGRDADDRASGSSDGGSTATAADGTVAPGGSR